MTSFIPPALASPFAEKRLAKGTWIAEQKWDGHRMIACTVGGDAPICWSRGLKLMSNVPEHIREALRRLPPAIVDGELVEVGDEGKSYGVSHARADAAAGARLRFVVFDVLNVRGMDCTVQPWDERRATLEEMLADAGTAVALSPIVGESISGAEHAWSVAHEVWERGGEGLILKTREAPYRPGKRMTTWMKMKREGTAVLALVGFEDGLMGACSVAVLEDEQGVRTTVKWKSHEWLADVREHGAGYVERRRPVRIEFTERTMGSYREPRWDRWEDE